MKISNLLLVVFFLQTLISSVTPREDHTRDLIAATEEMQKANYFTFVMLIKMSSPDTRLEGNVTFLMPNDRMLANVTLQEGSIYDFLLRHSIPSPLLFDVLKQFPTGTTVPSLLPNCTLRISNSGRKSFVVNNVKIISPNICMGGSSIRCHGIDGVLSETCIIENNYSIPVPVSSYPTNITNTSSNASPPIPSPSSPRDNLSPPTWTAPTPTISNVQPHKSGSSRWLLYNSPLIFVVCLILSFIEIYL
uniref:Uncharacterized protein LOC101503335 n=1 Tax=Cicer arietinum TaxID=3827 RepID=A0A1S2YRZ9_CICAR|nr:uncharacterized protein LOC101503335 [Cicer arietinum]